MTLEEWLKSLSDDDRNTLASWLGLEDRVKGATGDLLKSVETLQGKVAELEKLAKGAGDPPAPADPPKPKRRPAFALPWE